MRLLWSLLGFAAVLSLLLLLGYGEVRFEDLILVWQKAVHAILQAIRAPPC